MLLGGGHDKNGPGDKVTNEPSDNDMTKGRPKSAVEGYSCRKNRDKKGGNES